MGTLEGKVAIVSGSGRGIGRAIALKLASEGAAVVISDIDDAPAQEVVSEISAAGGKAAACVGDVTEPDFGQRFVNTAIETFGSLDIVVNNAGYTWDSVIQKMSDEQFQAMIDIHTVAPFRILRAASEYFRAQAKKEAEEGTEVFRKVVNISSVSGTRGNPGQVNYSAAKKAVIGITETLAKEWGRYKVNVNCVAYGMIATRLTQAVEGDKPEVKVGDRDVKVGIPAKQVEAAKAMIPMGRPGTPEEAAGAVYLFCLQEGNYVTGQTIVCGGGRE
ncbi:SDR family oxidoreductase [Pseudomaricurvus alkylphenolicus]|uniref:SDR family NAD(P)-dependent oxidoreductase n=1 Tax=Pseudomaricurvus alkylphenolicus TaxID=1306991 RepID=UPI0014232ADA|nr:SDR family oxidoreductase [Pseudomaricurvus alkylphenolicus]NIB38198.1 SDR family oxidoreductase [Pseudomaricurvus alkylphenolicus]